MDPNTQLPESPPSWLASNRKIVIVSGVALSVLVVALTLVFVRSRSADTNIVTTNTKTTNTSTGLTNRTTFHRYVVTPSPIVNVGTQIPDKVHDLPTAIQQLQKNSTP